MNKTELDMIVQEVTAHYGNELPKKSDYRKKPLAYLKRNEKKFAGYVQGFRRLIARPGRCKMSGRRFRDDRLSKALIKMYEDHRKAVLRAIEAKAGKAA